MDANTKHLIETLGPGVAKKVLMLQSAWFVSHGLLSSNETETFVSLGLSVVGALWSFWNEYGEGIFRSQMEVIKAKSLAQAAKLHEAGLPKVTASEIADQSTKLSTADVVKITSTLPPNLQNNIAAQMTVAGKTAALLLAIIALAGLLGSGSAHAAPKAAVLPAATDEPTSKCLIPWDPLKLCGALTGKPEEDFQRVVKRIQAIGRDDMNYAILKAKAANTSASLVRLQCLNAILAAKDAAEGTNIKDASGNVIPRPDPALVTGIEDIAELVDALSPTGPLMTGCAGAAQLVKTNTLSMINGIVTGAAGLAAGGFAIP